MPPATRVLAFLLVFTTLFLLALILSIAAEFSDAKWIQTAASIGARLESLTVIAVSVTFILVEGVPMLAHWIRQAEIKEARAEGRVEGRALEREAWQNWRRSLEAWEQRKADAEAAGRAFNESRPAPPADD